jgi:hypothetical protein
MGSRTPLVCGVPSEKCRLFRQHITACSGSDNDDDNEVEDNMSDGPGSSRGGEVAEERRGTTTSYL